MQARALERPELTRDPSAGAGPGTDEGERPGAAPETTRGTGPRVLIAGGGTGGHLYPALNLAAALRRREPDVWVLLLGAERGVEARVLPSAGWPYRLLPLEPLRRSRPWRNWRLVWHAPAVLRGLVRTFRELEPSLVVGTGGYASGPAVAWAGLAGRPTALQEQNAEPGLVTRLLAGRVDQLHLGYPEAAERLRPGRRTEVFAYGNPVDPEVGRAGERGGTERGGTERGGARRSAAERSAFDWPDGRIVLVAGGSQGARGLNRRLLADLAETAAWPTDVRMVWITGPTHYEEVVAGVGRLPWSEWIRVVPYLEGLGRHLRRVSLAITRAGAMFVAELAAAGVPAVFVPFPAAAGGHQMANARAMAEAGAAEVREEADLEAGELWSLAARILADEPRRQRMAEAARARGAPDAADRIAGELLRLARPRSGA